MAFGDVQGVFPFGSLVNHSCRPNSCFHSVAKASPQGPEVELVLRTTREVHVGDELCISYLVNYPEIPVAVSASDLTNRGHWRFSVWCIGLIRRDLCRIATLCFVEHGGMPRVSDRVPLFAEHIMKIVRTKYGTTLVCTYLQLQL